MQNLITHIPHIFLDWQFYFFLSVVAIWAFLIIDMVKKIIQDRRNLERWNNQPVTRFIRIPRNDDAVEDHAMYYYDEYFDPLVRHRNLLSANRLKPHPLTTIFKECKK